MRCIRYVKLSAITIIFIFSFSSLNSISLGINVLSTNINLAEGQELDFEGYIIKFKDDPISVYKSKIVNSVKETFTVLSEKLKNEIIKSKILDYKNTLLSHHNEVKEEIISLLGGNIENDKLFYAEFTELFNGLAIKNVARDVLDRIRNLNWVERVSPDYKIELFLDESVPLINAYDVWLLNDQVGRSITGKDVTVAVIDSGIDYYHPDLADNYIGGADYCNSDNDPLDDYGHGTSVAGVIAGVAPGVNIYAYKVSDHKGEGQVSDVIKAIQNAVDPDGDSDYSDRFIEIVSMSFGVDSSGVTPDDYLCQVVDNAADAGVVMVAAAGNDGRKGSETINSPGMARKVICVGATDKSDNVASFSSRGPVRWNDNEIIKPDIVAPGVDIRAPFLDGCYAICHGTSFSTPHVSGVAALLLQAHPDWDHDDVKTALKENAYDLGLDENISGNGRIDALASIGLTSHPPIAKLDVPHNIEKGGIPINGTAMNGTGNHADFVEYSLYYTEKNKNNWVLINESTEEVNDDTLCIWNTTLIENGAYRLKLEVIGSDQTSIDIETIVIGNIDDELLIIETPMEIDENQYFTVNITDNKGNPTNAWILFYVPLRCLRLRYGSSIQFKAPKIYSKFTPSLNGKIFAIKIIGIKKGIGEITINNKVI